MSGSTPFSLNAFSSAGRSPFSQRLDDAASGRMMQARLPAAPPLAPPLASPAGAGAAVSRLHPANDTAASPAMSVATAAFLVSNGSPLRGGIGMTIRLGVRVRSG